MARTILIVDDNALNRELLKGTMGGDYDILEAADGQAALELIRSRGASLSAVLLDIKMPVMDGYETLRRIRDSAEYAQLPVIMITGYEDEESRVKALSLGANDFIVKPYNPEIIRHCLKNNITLRETASIISAIQRDKLTGLYNREMFFEKADEAIREHDSGFYLMSSLDINNFKLINDQYGTAEGDRILRRIGKAIDEDMRRFGGIGGRIGGDNFAVLLPVSRRDMSIIRLIQQDKNYFSSDRAIVFSVGRCLVSDLSLPASSLYDRAYIAKQSVKGRYDERIAYFDEAMLEKLVQDQQIIADMDEAVAQKQFEVWLQPQYNHSTGALIGAEALARWRHPERGLIYPGEFIPVFEQNGFVYELDRFIWEECCRLLRRWTDEGRTPLPISVNISRYDIFRKDLVGYIAGLVEQYGLEPAMLRLEITESAFAKSTETVISIVKELVERGFTVEIDDFGSGYSSLNTLKSVPAQVVKLDMRFLEDDEGSQRGGNILESVVRMNKWLGLAVIAEGVETKAQADYLKSIGCAYVQGYLYARPMLPEDYIRLARESGREERLIALETVANLNNNAFWDPDSMDTLIFNSYVGAACIFEYNEGNVELLRANDKYAQILGGGNVSVEETLKLDWLSALEPESRVKVRKVLRRSAQTGKEMTTEYVFANIPHCPDKVHLRATMRVIATAGKRMLVYCMCENITGQRQAERNVKKIARQFKTVLDNVSCGITAAIIRDGDGELLISNNRYYEMLGYTREQFKAEIGSSYFKTVHPGDRLQVSRVLLGMHETGGSATLEFRAVRRDGETVWIRCAASMTTFDDVPEPVQLCIYVDLTAEKLMAQRLLDNLPSGAALFEYSGGGLRVLNLNKRYWELTQRTPTDYSDRQVIELVHPEDRDIALQALEEAIREHRDAVCDLRLPWGDSGYRLFRVVARILEESSGRYSIYATFTAVTDEETAIKEMLPVALQTMMETQNDYSFIMDKNLRYVCCSRAYAELFGLSSEDMTGRTDDEVIAPELARRYRAENLRLLKSGRSLIDVTQSTPTSDGSSRYTSTSKYVMRDSAGKVIGIYGIGRDITKALQADSRLKTLTDSIPGGLAVYSSSAEAPDKIAVDYFSDGFSSMFGYSRGEYEKLCACDPFIMVFPEEKAGLIEQIRALIKTGSGIDIVFRARHKDGGTKYINIKAVPGETDGRRITVNAVLFDVTERQQAVERLRISEEENRLAMRHSGGTICRFNVEERTLIMPPTADSGDTLPTVIEDVPYSVVESGDVSPESAKDYIDFYESIIRGVPLGAVSFKRRNSNGWRWLEAQFTTIFSDSGMPRSAVITYQDVTERLEKDSVYRRWQQSIQEREAGAFMLYRCNISKNISFDSQEGSLLSIDHKEGPLSFDERTEEYVEQCVFEEDAARYLSFLKSDTLLASYYRGKRTCSMQYREKLPDGGVRWLQVAVDMVEHPNGSDVEAFLLYENIDESKRAELMTLEQAETDPLTGVLNRGTLASRVNSLIKTAKPGNLHALLMLDVDGFKLVNDVFGHASGDQILRDIARALRSVLRKGDIIGRLGGDEFIVFLPDIPNDIVAADKARQICALTRRSLSLEVEVSSSIGIAVSPRDGEDFESLYHKADVALYSVKGSGKDNFIFYHDNMPEEHLQGGETESAAGAEAREKKQKRRLLVVDDNRMDCALVSRIFSGEFIVDKANDGSTAMVRLRHYGSAISAVLLDLMMPGMDGFAILKRMRESAELRSIPVIIVSSAEDRETSLNAIRSGAADFVAKPVESELLRLRVNTAIAKAENERLQAKRCIQDLQNMETVRYKTILERSGIAVIEYDWVAGSFEYDPLVTQLLAGNYDQRRFWHILLADLVADTKTVKDMQELVHALAEDRSRQDSHLVVSLKTPAKVFHWFRFSIFKQTDDFGLTGRILMTLLDLGDSLPT